MKKLVTLLSFGLLLAACSGPTETVTSEPITVTMTADFPLYEGANTSIGEFEVDLDQLLNKQGFIVDNIKNVKLTAASLTIADSDYTGLMDQISLQLTTSNSGMQKVGLLNPVPMGKETIVLQMAAEQKGLAAMFKENKIVVVADINLIEDLEDDFVFELVMNFEFEVKP
ncbi:MAG: hypothetical protein LAT76_11650 [Schleiferiaceae bacterium]|nr:hypothetical protein [Schleiferiaceae bacterium]